MRRTSPGSSSRPRATDASRRSWRSPTEHRLGSSWEPSASVGRAMEPFPDRRRHPPAAALANLIIPPPVVEREVLDGLIEGWCELAERGFVHASLLLIAFPS